MDREAGIAVFDALDERSLFVSLESTPNDGYIVRFPVEGLNAFTIAKALEAVEATAVDIREKRVENGAMTIR